MSRRRRSCVALALLAGGALTSLACTNEPVPERPVLTGSVPGGGTVTVLPTLPPDTIPTTVRPAGSSVAPGSSVTSGTSAAR
jgi:hypothetical protein